MARNGGDYAWGRPSIAAMKAAGWTFVSRYLSYESAASGSGKNLSAAEARTLLAGGIDVVSNWEWWGDWAHDYSGGYARGAQHARDANTQHLNCGGPPGRPIYFSTDFDPTDAQLPTIADYYRGAASVLGLARVGAYGGYRTIKYLFDHGVIRYGWQTYAWSGGRWDPRAQVRQVRNGVLVGGVDCDLDTALVDDFGQWGGASAPDTTATQEDHMLRLGQTTGSGTIFVGNGYWVWPLPSYDAVQRQQAAIAAAGGDNSIHTFPSEDAMRAALSPVAVALAAVGGALSAAAGDVTAVKAAVVALAAAGTSADTAVLVAKMEEISADVLAREDARIKAIADLQAKVADALTIDPPPTP
jgi:hypothetical protein